jgi:hydroxymethylpyrimidine/phosphomethylpyrimidine kinase
MNSHDLTNADVPVVLTIASSDSGAGTGIQADLKTFSVLNVFGTCAITAVTAQTPRELRHLHPVPASVLLEQIQAVSDDFPISAAKTGMLPTRELVEAVVHADEAYGFPILVVDPRMVTSSGAQVMDPDAVEALKDLLLPIARVVTPNIFEAQILAGFPIANRADLRRAAQTIANTFDIACVAKGGDLPGSEVIDILFDEGEEFEFSHPRVDIPRNHGAGCTLSAALAANLAKGMLMADALDEARKLVARALARAWNIGPHRPLHLSID